MIRSVSPFHGLLGLRIEDAVFSLLVRNDAGTGAHDYVVPLGVGAR